MLTHTHQSRAPFVADAAEVREAARFVQDALEAASGLRDWEVHVVGGEARGGAVHDAGKRLAGISMSGVDDAWSIVWAPIALEPADVLRLIAHLRAHCADLVVTHRSRGVEGIVQDLVDVLVQRHVAVPASQAMSLVQVSGVWACAYGNGCQTYGHNTLSRLY